MRSNQRPNAIGLRLPRRALRVLTERGIFAQVSVGLHYQNLANRYIVRGVESGGAAGDTGRYVTFAQENGEPLECLHPVESIGVNGPHAVVVAPVLVRLDMLRKGRTYELLISRHAPGSTDSGRRPPLQTAVLFRGVHGRLEVDLSSGAKAHQNGALPTFYSLAGEQIPIPRMFEPAVRSLVKAVNCSGCSHSHYVVALRTGTHSATPVGNQIPASRSHAESVGGRTDELEISATLSSESPVRNIG